MAIAVSILPSRTDVSTTQESRWNKDCQWTFLHLVCKMQHDKGQWVQAHTTEVHIDNFQKTCCNSCHHPWPTGILKAGQQSNCDGQSTTRQHNSFTENDEGNKQGATRYLQGHLSFLDSMTAVSNLTWQILLTVISHSTLRHGIYHLPSLM